MANPLPPGAIPKLYRQRNKDGKEVGAWYCPKVKGKLDKAVNLKTQDYMKARVRAHEVLYQNRRDFPDDRYFDDAGKPTPPNERIGETDDWTTDATRAASQSIEPDEIIPPNRQLSPSIEAPDETVPPPNGAPTVTPEPPKTTEDGTQIPPEMMEGLIKQIAATAVELQIHGQEYLWLRFAKLDPGAVPYESDARKIPQAIWESQLKKWLPTDVPIPEWAAAILLTGVMAGTVQFQGAKPMPPNPPTDAPAT